MDRPYVICHMVTSLDGKVTGEFLHSPAAERATDVYYELNRDFRSEAFACGRVTMEESFTGGWTPDLTPFQGSVVPREDYRADRYARFFAVAFDPHGRLGWKGSRIEDEDPGYGGAHIVEVLCEDVPDAYLAYLQSVRVSYVFAGKDEIDLALALNKLSQVFGIHKLLLEGGSILNGAFHRAGLIDALSLVTAPVTAQADGKPLFQDGRIEEYRLKDAVKYDDNALWLVCVRGGASDDTPEKK